MARILAIPGHCAAVLLTSVETGVKLNPRLFILKDFDNR